MKNNTSETERLELFITKIDSRIEKWFDTEEIDPTHIESLIGIREKLLKRLGELNRIRNSKWFWNTNKDPLDKIRNRLSIFQK